MERDCKTKAISDLAFFMDSTFIALKTMTDS